MISKITLLVALFAFVHAGHEAPPPKAHTYSVPSVAKVSYPAPTITKSVETYSAPSIEKTTTITRTITAPLNAPPVKSIQYSAPAAPLVKALTPQVYAAPSYAAPVGTYAAPAAVYSAAYSPQKAVYAPTLAFAIPNHGYGSQQLLAYAAPHSAAFATTYGTPSVGYNLGHYAAAPAVAKVVSPEYGH